MQTCASRLMVRVNTKTCCVTIATSVRPIGTTTAGKVATSIAPLVPTSHASIPRNGNPLQSGFVVEPEPILAFLRDGNRSLVFVRCFRRAIPSRWRLIDTFVSEHPRIFAAVAGGYSRSTSASYSALGGLRPIRFFRCGNCTSTGGSLSTSRRASTSARTILSRSAATSGWVMRTKASALGDQRNMPP